MQCCRVDDMSPENTIVGLPPGWVDTHISRLNISINPISQVARGHLRFPPISWWLQQCSRWINKKRAGMKNLWFFIHALYSFIHIKHWSDHQEIGRDLEGTHLPPVNQFHLGNSARKATVTVECYRKVICGIVVHHTVTLPKISRYWLTGKTRKLIRTHQEATSKKYSMSPTQPKL